MSESCLVSVVVPDREFRDLICLNLRFESINTVAYKSIDEYLLSDSESDCAVIDISNEKYADKLITRIHETIGEDYPVVFLIASNTPCPEGENYVVVSSNNGRKKFDAAELVKAVVSLTEIEEEDPTRHPLTGLPSGSIVEKYITGLLSSGSDFSLIVSDMDNMKAFNQRFGYAEGDRLLCGFVTLMKHVLDKNPGDLSFIGHRGKDDFVIITAVDQAVTIAEKIVDGFDEMIGEFFPEDESSKGFFSINDRRGNPVNFPLTTVSLVIVNTLGRGFTHPAELYDVTGELMAKVKARGINQSYCAVDRRASKTQPEEFMV